MPESKFTIEVEGCEALFIRYGRKGWHYYGTFRLSASQKLREILEVINAIPEGYAGLDYPELLKAIGLL